MQNHGRYHALMLDEHDPLKHLRKEFIIPSTDDISSKTLFGPSSEEDKVAEPCIYLCGNSLGLQPRRTAERVSAHLSAWAKKAVTGHMTGHDDSELPPFLHVDEVAAEKMAPIVGALKSEVAVMETLTANLHFLMASFYRPSKEKYKIILEGKAFPSDHYAIESQIRHHEFDPKDAMILIEPLDPDSSIITTSHIISTIDQHASSTALILLPGVQYYTGQYLDIKKITAHAHSRGILIGWDLAHAVGNVDVQLHDWEVDFAAWCNYKYVNSGPGAIAGLFVHSKHGKVDLCRAEDEDPGYRPRFCGWWGHDKATRFEMGNEFTPIPGAAGFQLGNPSALAITALLASLEIFSMTSMSAIRTKSILLTKYLEDLLLLPPQPQPQPQPPSLTEIPTGNSNSEQEQTPPQHLPPSSSSHYRIITPHAPSSRGAQLSIRLLNSDLLDGVLKALKDAGIVVDARKPDVIRVAPAPLYNTFVEVYDFVRIFREVCGRVAERVDGGGDEVVDGGGHEGVDGSGDEGGKEPKKGNKLRQPRKN